MGQIATPGADAPVSKTKPTHDIHDFAQELSNALLQLEAMLCLAYGGRGEALRNCSDHIQDNYFWGCADKAESCRKQAELLQEMLFDALHGDSHV